MTAESKVPIASGSSIASESTTASDYPIVILLADGWTRSVFKSLLDAGDLAGISGELLERGQLIDRVVSNVPSVSIASHASILTSEYQDRHQIPGHRWYDTAGRECHNYLSLRGAAKVNSDLDPSVQTIFERHREADGIAVQSVVRRGANRISQVMSLRAGPILERTADLVRDHPRSVTVAWLPRGDAMGHIHGPNSPEARQEIVDSSAAIAVFVKRLGSIGVLDTARIVLIPDHGQRDVCHTVDLQSLLSPKFGHVSVNPRWAGSADVVAMTSGDSSVHIYSRGHTRSEELAQHLLHHPGIALTCWTADGSAFFASKQGVAEGTLQTDGQIRYRRLYGKDPLELLENHLSELVWNGNEPCLSGRFPDLVHQYARSHVAARSGSVLAVTAEDFQFKTRARVGYRLGNHRGTHGGPFASEVLVSAVTRNTAMLPDKPIRSADLLQRLGLMSTLVLA